MCQHNRFDILYYDGGTMVRRCKDCGEVEMRVEYWESVNEVAHVVHEIEGPEASAPA